MCFRALVLGCDCSEVLGDDYVSTTKVKVATSTADGRTFTVAGSKDAKSGDLGADLQVKQKMGSRTLTTKLFTDGSATTEVKLEKLGLEGLKTTLLFGVGKKKGEFTMEYANGPIAMKSSADYYSKKVKGSATCRLKSTTLTGYAVIGGEATYDITKGETKGMNAALSYFDNKESELTLHVFDKGASGKLSYSHLVQPDLSVAAEMTYNRESEEAKLLMGGAVQLDAMTKLKGKLASDGVCAVSYIQNIRPKTELVLTAAFNVKEMKEPKLGLSLAIE